MAKRSTKVMSVWGLILIGIAVFMLAAGGVYYLADYFRKPVPIEQPSRVTITPTTIVNSVTIYLPIRKNSKIYLAPETRTVNGKDGILDLAIRTLLDEGSRDGGDGTVIPTGVKLLNPVTIENDIAAIDLSREMLDNFSGGSDQEALTLNAIAQTACHADSKVHKIKILVGGKPVDSLGGHYDLTMPISPDQDLIQPE